MIFEASIDGDVFLTGVGHTIDRSTNDFDGGASISMNRRGEKDEKTDG